MMWSYQYLSNKLLTGDAMVRNGRQSGGGWKSGKEETVVVTVKSTQTHTKQGYMRVLVLAPLHLPRNSSSSAFASDDCVHLTNSCIPNYINKFACLMWNDDNIVCKHKEGPSRTSTIIIIIMESKRSSALWWWWGCSEIGRLLCFLLGKSRTRVG